MGARYLEIIAELKEKVTERLEKMDRGFDRFEKALARSGQQMKAFGRDLSSVGNNMALLGAAIDGPLLLAFNNSAQYSLRVTDQINRMKNAASQFQLTIANALVPIFERFTNVLGLLLDKWNGLDPVIRQNAIQAVFMSGIYLSLGGILVTLIGKVFTFAGNVQVLGSKLLGLATAHPILLGISAAILLMISNWEDLRRIAIPVLNVLEMGALTVAVAWTEMQAAIFESMALIADQVPKVVNVISKIPSVFGVAVKSVSSNVTAFSTDIRDASRDIESRLLSMQTKLVGLQRNIAVTGRGAFVGMAQGIGQGVEKLREFINLLQNAPAKKFQDDMIAKFDFIKTMLQGVKQAMENSLGDAIFNSITGHFESLKQVVADFGQQLLRVLSDALAKLVVWKVFAMAGLGAFHQGGMVMHSGGMIPNIHSSLGNDGLAAGTIRRAHTGMLANDEVPIIAQTGERILSRREVSILGGPENIDRAVAGFPMRSGQSSRDVSSFGRSENINRGSPRRSSGGQSQPTTIQYFIQAVDAPSFIELLGKNKAVINQIVVANMDRNGSVRQGMKRS